MRKNLFAVLALCGAMCGPVVASASTLACPDLAQASQVGACPTEEELRHTFSGYCSDDAKAYRGETDVCTDYQQYKALKNVAMWESADGRFDAYVSCAAAPAKVQGLKAQSMKLVTQGKINRLVCSYPNGVDFSFRTRSRCEVEAAACGNGGKDCRARCDD